MLVERTGREHGAAPVPVGEDEVWLAAGDPGDAELGGRVTKVIAEAAETACLGGQEAVEPGRGMPIPPGRGR